MPAQHRVLVPEHEQLGIFRPVAAERQDGQAKYPAPITTSIMLATVQVTHSIEYSSGTGPCPEVTGDGAGPVEYARTVLLRKAADQADLPPD